MVLHRPASQGALLGARPAPNSMIGSKRQVKPLRNVTASQAPCAASTPTPSGSKRRKVRETDQHNLLPKPTRRWPPANSPRGTQALCPCTSESPPMRPQPH